MATFNYAYNSNIFLDRCPQCGVVWIDADERARVMRYLRGNPKVDRLASALADYEQQRRDGTLLPDEPKELWLETCIKEALRPDTPLLTRVMWAGLAALIVVIVVGAIWLRLQR